MCAARIRRSEHRAGNGLPMLRQIVHAINVEQTLQLIASQLARYRKTALATEEIDVLSGVDRTLEPIGFIAVAIPRIAEGVAIHHGTHGIRIGFERLFELFHRDAVVVHAFAYPRDETLTCVAIEVEQPLFFSLFHNVPVPLLLMLAFENEDFAGQREAYA
jgi:hypothetical protein